MGAASFVEVEDMPSADQVLGDPANLQAQLDCAG